MSKRDPPEKFYFVEVKPQPCSAAELKMHLAEFGHAFVSRDRRERWTHITQERPEKAKDEIGKLIWETNEQLHEPLFGSNGFPNALKKRFGNKMGVYFNGIDEPCKVTAVEASSLAASYPVDALFSIMPGKLAIFFFHEGDVIVFEKSQ